MRTLIGRLSQKDGTYKAHHGTFEEDDVKRMKRTVKWEDRQPFHVIPLVYRYNVCLQQSSLISFFLFEGVYLFHLFPITNIRWFHREMQRKKEHGGDLEKKWNSILRYYETKYNDEAKDFKVLLDGGLPSGWDASLPVNDSLTTTTCVRLEILYVVDHVSDMLDFMDINQRWSTSDPVDATRGYSERCLNALVKVLPGLIGGSAD